MIIEKDLKIMLCENFYGYIIYSIIPKCVISFIAKTKEWNHSMISVLKRANGRLLLCCDFTKISICNATCNNAHFRYI